VALPIVSRVTLSEPFLLLVDKEDKLLPFWVRVAYKDRRGAPFVVSITSPPYRRLIMSHTHHHVSFFRNSSVFSAHRGVILSCVAFHHYVILSEADADLCWAHDLCFSCRLPGHRAERCPRSFHSERLTCSLLMNPTSKSGFASSWAFLVIDYLLSVGRP
jgi:hypothetical protein